MERNVDKIKRLEHELGRWRKKVADTAKENIEVHLLDFNENIYGQDIEVEFIEWLRPMRAFESTDELIATVKGNIAWVRENL